LGAPLWRRVAQEAGLGLLALELFELLVHLVQGDLLNQNRLRQNIQRVRAASDTSPDQLVGIGVDLWCGRLLDAGGKLFEQLTFLVGHGNLSFELTILEHESFHGLTWICKLL
jgi:hypothetical protein